MNCEFNEGTMPVSKNHSVDDRSANFAPFHLSIKRQSARKRLRKTGISLKRKCTYSYVNYVLLHEIRNEGCDLFSGR